MDGSGLKEAITCLYVKEDNIHSLSVGNYIYHLLGRHHVFVHSLPTRETNSTCAIFSTICKHSAQNADCKIRYFIVCHTAYRGHVCWILD